MRFLKRLLAAIRRQIAVVFAIADYDMDRKSTQSSIGNWQGVIEPMNMMLFFIAMRVGFSYLRGTNRFAAGGSTDMYFNIVVFIVSGFSLAFLFRNVAMKALSGLKLRAPLYYPRVKPLDILMALSINDFRALATLSLAGIGLVWLSTWSFRLDSPGLAISVYVITVIMAMGFGLCVIFSRCFF